MMPELALDPQLASLLGLSLAGLVLGVVFDFLRSCSRILRFSKKTIIITDLLFCLAASLFVFSVLFQVNRGEVRFYTFFSLGLGLFVYFIVFSAFVYWFFFRGMAIIRDFLLKITKMFARLQDFFKKV